MANAQGKRMLYRVKSSTTEDGKTVYSVLSCADDVEHRRHRRNPFDVKYVQAVLSFFETIGQNDNPGSVSRSEVEAASANVHVRMELIKTMKENLAKTTSEAVKHYRRARRKECKKDSSVNAGEEMPDNLVSSESCDSVSERHTFHCRDIHELYLAKFGSFFENLQAEGKKYGKLSFKTGTKRMPVEQGTISLDLKTAVHLLENHAKDNPNFLRDEDLCFNLDKEVTETLESFMRRFGPAEALPLDINVDGEADIKAFQRHIKTVTKELILDANDSDTEEPPKVDLAPQEDQQSSCPSVSEKGDMNKSACRVESEHQSEYAQVLDGNPHFHETFSLNSKEQYNLMGDLSELEMNDHIPCKCDGNRDKLNFTLEGNLFLDLEKKSTKPDQYSEASVLEHFGFPEQAENQQFSPGSRHANNVSWINQGKGLFEDADSIEEFADDSIQNSTLEKVDSFSSNKSQQSKFAEFSSVIETEDTDINWDELELEDKFGGLPYSSDQNENQSSGIFRICFNAKEVVKFQLTKAQQSRKKCHWLVNDVEKLLDATEASDDDGNTIECSQESFMPKIVVGPKMFLSSLSRPLLNLVEHCKQLQESPSKITGALHFRPLAGDCADFDSVELSDLVVQDIKDSSCGFVGTGQSLDHQNQTKSSFKDSIGHGLASRKLHHKACIQGVNWDDMPWTSEATVSENGTDTELHMAVNVDPTADNSKMMIQNKYLVESVGSKPREPEEWDGSNKHANHISHNKGSEHSDSTQMCDTLKCLAQEVLHVDYEQDDRIWKEPVDHHKENCDGSLEVEDLNEDFVDQHAGCLKQPKKPSGNQIISERMEHLLEHTGDQNVVPSEKLAAQSVEDAEGKSSNPVQISNDVSCGKLPLSNFCGIGRSEDKFDDKDHSRQKQRKRYRLDDLITDMVMAECQFHQQTLYHFDLEPLSWSLAAGISSLHAQEHVTNISFGQLLEASKVSMNCQEDGVITKGRLYMALLTLAHQQNIGSLKRPILEGYQIHLQATSGGFLKDIMINLEPLLTNQDGCDAFPLGQV